MTEEEKEQFREVLAEELHHIDEAHGLKRIEEMIAFVGLTLMILCVMAGLVDWSPIPPVAAEVIKQVRAR